MTKSYAIEDLEIGMVLAEEINIKDGLIVIKADVEIDESIIEIFKKHQVDFVVIQEPMNPGHAYTDEEIQKMKSDIEEHKKMLFQDCFEDEYMKKLFKAVCDFRLAESIDG